MVKLDRLVRDLFDEESTPIGEETPFAGVDGWDSLKHVELILAMETRFGIELTAGEIGRLTCKRSAREVLMARHVDD